MRSVGRPQVNIDWNIVDELLEAGCSGVEIAANIGIKPVALYDRCVTDNGMIFTEYSQEKAAKGEAILRKVQFDKAIGKAKDADNTMLVWLGKVRLKQKEESTHTVMSQEYKELNASVVTAVSGNQEANRLKEEAYLADKARKEAESTNNTESMS